MLTTIVPGIVEIWVSRDHDTYTHRVCTNGVFTSANIIPQARAKEIIGLNPDGRVRGMNQVDWTPGAKQFTWIARLEEAIA